MYIGLSPVLRSIVVTSNGISPEKSKVTVFNFNLHYFGKANARLRGWQRTTTKLKHNNCNHRGSMGLETPRVDSPS
ncbi:hypothetical protein CGT92_17845 [Vibrio metoecus]|nr:hypothetical protein CGT92_17845 [Vibrio metoecus]PAR59917.1 hypothetical protein CGT91_17370 [Vibrio metoecus]